MRGKALYLGTRQRAQGITPAYAGKSVTARKTKSINLDHPRVCGEKLPVRRAAAGRAGSPPRMRGKEKPLGKGRGKSRITPAYAGKRCAG